jgi:hypothetical protein
MRTSSADRYAPTSNLKVVRICPPESAEMGGHWGADCSFLLDLPFPSFLCGVLFLGIIGHVELKCGGSETS